jgi:cytochrome c peroxidase
MKPISRAVVSLALVAAACDGVSERAAEPLDDPTEAPTEAPAEAARESELVGGGRALFAQALPASNGRSCATCHVLDEHTALSVATDALEFGARVLDRFLDDV